jgi:type IV pilus assembly protein PilC
VLFGDTELKQRAIFFRELATLVDSGMTLGQAVSTLEPRIMAGDLRRAIRDAGKKVSDGRLLSDVMRGYPAQFSRLAVAMVQAGERGGRLDTMLVRLAEYMERDVNLRAMVARETFYPKVLLCAILFIPLAAQVAIAALAPDHGNPVLILVKWLLIYAVCIGGPIVAIRAAVISYGKTKQGRQNLDRLKLRVPLLGKVIHRIAMAKFCRALAALYDAGVPLTECLRLAGDSAANAGIQATARLAEQPLEKGEKLSASLARAGMLDDLVLRMLQTGEDSGHIDEMMDKVADYYEAESETAIKQMGMMVVPIAVVIGGIAVFVILLRAYGSYFGSLMGQ